MATTPWPLGASPLPYKRPPSPPHNTHLLVKDLSPPLVIPHGLGLARYMFSVALSEKELLLPLLCWSEGRRLLGYRTCVRSRMHRCFAVLDLVVLELDLKDVLEPNLLGLPHDLEIGKCTTTSTTSSYSLTKLVVYEGKFALDVCPPVALYLVDRSWRIVHIIGIFLFSML